MRGENINWVRDRLGEAGTSPRARGKPGKKSYRKYSRRNIPACAGKTYQAGVLERVKKEHPRVRGENLFGWRAER